MKEEVKKGWVLCEKCGHKLFRLLSHGSVLERREQPTIEIKCSSCGAMNVLRPEIISVTHNIAYCIGKRNRDVMFPDGADSTTKELAIWRTSRNGAYHWSADDIPNSIFDTKDEALAAEIAWLDAPFKW